MTERMTACGRRLHLRLAIDYSARDALRRAAIAACSATTWSPVEFERRLRSGRGVAADTPDVDLLVRTGGEQRLSDFLLWECAYAELWFTSTPWPAFTARELGRAIADFRSRQRRFGGLSQPLAALKCGPTAVGPAVGPDFSRARQPKKRPLQLSADSTPHPNALAAVPAAQDQAAALVCWTPSAAPWTEAGP
jgi:Putative undecaprenyl diphosphate synthase